DAGAVAAHRVPAGLVVAAPPDAAVPARRLVRADDVLHGPAGRERGGRAMDGPRPADGDVATAAGHALPRGDVADDEAVGDRVVPSLAGQRRASGEPAAGLAVAGRVERARPAELAPVPPGAEGGGGPLEAVGDDVGAVLHVVLRVVAAGAQQRTPRLPLL